MEGLEVLARKATGDEPPAKRVCYGREFYGLNLSIERPLEDMEPEKLKEEIKRWAKAVALYILEVRQMEGSSMEATYVEGWRK
ncbi:hypothetical protein QJS10_CPB20g00497 [Acorus calamus]|uniref:Uncharacterized protein n=1 Tax=Acorus calamus TaxID=4465 RepID=A0AAV9CAJ6_ACOCL|nr:hypothetical protein QJS10_CPB20g00497 [Acorus calamus]